LQALLFLRQVSSWLQPGLGHDAAGLGTCQLHPQGTNVMTHHADSCVISGAHSNIDQPLFASCLLLLLLLL
jgi:hypothetical protein